MRDEHDDRLNEVARELKRAERLGAEFDERVMRAVRRLPEHSRLSWWSRLTRPRRVTVTPLSWGLMATAMLVFAVLGTRGLVDEAASAERAVALSAAETSPTVQFVLVAPAAKKVAVVGDFNGWDPSHEGYQAEHRGGGVWAVTAPVPVGHHKYSFVIDDSVWVADPIAPRAVDNDFGVTNSALVVVGQE